VEMATLCEFDENDRFFTTHFTLNRIQRIAFKKMHEKIIKLDKILKDWLIQICIKLDKMLKD
jgi:hypothetical protein